ncbi:hypothetical protein FQR65_LT05401 [Abscondita terminalis]|nr:hypothetical protein FQR65_LT05401 [Abscondita terminalis]
MQDKLSAIVAFNEPIIAVITVRRNKVWSSKMIGAAIFALSLWLRFEPGLEEWIEKLELYGFYTGLYILILAGLLMMIVSFLGCLSVVNEHRVLLLGYVGSQALGFLIGSIGSAFLLENSTQDSSIQPVIRESIRRLIMNSHHEISQKTLAMVQENIGCCGADGPSDYLDLKQPVPTECRDTVTGNSFYHGCVDELTWYFEEKAAWITGLTMVVCFLLVSNTEISVNFKLMQFITIPPNEYFNGNRLNVFKDLRCGTNEIGYFQHAPSHITITITIDYIHFLSFDASRLSKYMSLD